MPEVVRLNFHTQPCLHLTHDPNPCSVMGRVQERARVAKGHLHECENILLALNVSNKERGDNTQLLAEGRM